MRDTAIATPMNMNMATIIFIITIITMNMHMDTTRTTGMRMHMTEKRIMSMKSGQRQDARSSCTGAYSSRQQQVLLCASARPAGLLLLLSTSCVYCHTQVEQNAVDLEGAESPGFNTAEALRTLLTKKGIITPEVCTDQHRLMQQITGSNSCASAAQAALQADSHLACPSGARLC